MGSLAKRIGQLSAKSLESESSQILRTIRSNKIPNSLSQKLDTTLKDSHDMKVFGLGTLSSMSNIDRYARFTHSMYGIYSTMEHELDLTTNLITTTTTTTPTTSSPDPKEPSSPSSSSSPPSEAVSHFWTRHEYTLRRSEKLKQDFINAVELEGGGSCYDINDIDDMEYSPATKQYMEAIQIAGTYDRDHGGGRLLGHAYTRYLADLMGGQVLATPTTLALGLKENVQQYSFDFNEEDVDLGRKEYVEKIYQDLNISGNMLLEGQFGNDLNENKDMLEEIVNEARSAFQHNIDVYSEEPIYLDSIIGVKNIISGWAFSKR